MISGKQIANLFAAVFLAVVIAAATKIIIFPDEPATVVIALLALIVSIASNFKNDLFPFQLKILAGNIWLYQPDRKISGTIFILEIFFVNQGYADGIIKAIVLKLIDAQGREKLYSTIDEMDATLVREITFDTKPGAERKGSHDFFGPFPVHSKQSLKKFISFELREEDSQTLEWLDGSYKFEIYIASSEWESWKKVFEFEHRIDSEILTVCQRQTSFRLPGGWSPQLTKDLKNLISNGSIPLLQK